MRAWFVLLALFGSGCARRDAASSSPLARTEQTTPAVIDGHDPMSAPPDDPDPVQVAPATDPTTESKPEDGKTSEVLVLLHRAQADVEDGAYEKAMSVYREAMHRAPGRLDIVLRAGNTCLLAGNLTEARIWFETAYRLGDRTSGLTRTLGELAMTLGEPEAALQWYTHALAETPNDPALRLRRVYALVALGHDARASAEAEPLAHHRTKDVAGAAFYVLGFIAHREHRLDDALAAWQRAFDRGVRDPEMLQSMVADARSLGRDDEVAAVCGQVTAEDAALAARLRCAGGAS